MSSNLPVSPLQRPNQGEEQKDGDNFCLEIDPTDTYNNSQILKRGPVTMSQSILGPSVTRQLIFCSNHTLYLLKTPSQLIRSLTVEQIDALRSHAHKFFLDYSSLLEGEADPQEEAR